MDSMLEERERVIEKVTFLKKLPKCYLSQFQISLCINSGEKNSEIRVVANQFKIVLMFKNKNKKR